MHQTPKTECEKTDPARLDPAALNAASGVPLPASPDRETGAAAAIAWDSATIVANARLLTASRQGPGRLRSARETSCTARPARPSRSLRAPDRP